MAGPDAEDEHPYIAGDGDYAIEVAGGARHQDRLEWLAQGRGEESVQYTCAALLAAEPDNPFDPNAVSVSIRGVRVGYLPSDAAATMTAAMQTWGFDRAICEAVIEGGWYRSADDKGDFRVRLDANRDFMPAVDSDEDAAPPRYAVVAPAMASPKTANNLKSVGLGAVATLAMLVLIGIAWLVVQPTARSVTSQTAALSVAEPEPDPRPRRQAGSRLRDGAAETVAQRPSKPELDGLSPVVAVTEAAREASAVPAAQLLHAAAPVARSTALGVGEPARGTAVRRTAAVSPSSFPEVVRRVLDPKLPVASLATPVAAEIRPLIAAAIAPPALRPVAQSTLSAAQVAARAPASADAALAAREPDARPAGAQSPAAGGAGDRDAKVASHPEPKAQSASRRHRVNRLSRTESRAARAKARSRYTTRHSRRTRQAVQVRQDPNPAPSRPAAGVALPPGTMATRMLEGLTREWTSRAMQPLMAPRPRQ